MTLDIITIVNELQDAARFNILNALSRGIENREIG
jgi:hypothetical protein